VHGVVICVLPLCDALADDFDVKRIKVDPDEAPVAAQESPQAPYTPDPYEPVYIQEAEESSYRNQTCCYSRCQHPIVGTIDPDSMCYSCHRPVHTLEHTGACMHCNGGLLCSTPVECCDEHAFTVCHDCWFADNVDLRVLMDIFRHSLYSAGVHVHPHARMDWDREARMAL
jgi:hypothetical protein